MRSAKLHPEKPMYTFWDYKRNRWPRDAGLRLDHLLLSPARAAPAQGRRRPEDPRRGRRQRPCAGVGRVEVAASPQFLPSMTVTVTASRSKSSSSRALTAIFGLSKSGFPVDQSGDSKRFRSRNWRKMMFDGAAAPPIGRDIFRRRRQAKLCGRIVGPQRAAFRAQRTGAACHIRRRLAHLELRVAAMAASLDRHDALLSMT